MKNKKVQFFSLILVALSVLFQGCGSVPSYVIDLQASLALNNILYGTNQGDLTDIHRYYKNREYERTLEGANYLLHDSVFEGGSEYVQVYLLRFKSNVALLNYDDARKDFNALSSLPEYFGSDFDNTIAGYIAIADNLEMGANRASLDRLPALLNVNGDRIYIPGLDYHYGLLYILLGDMELAKTHFMVALEHFQGLKIFYIENSGFAFSYSNQVTSHDSYIRIINTYLGVLDEISSTSIQRLERLDVNDFPSPLEGGGIITTTSDVWDMPYDPFLLDTSVAALRNWEIAVNEGGDDLVASFIQEGRYLEAYEHIGNTYRMARLDQTVRQLANVMRAYTPSEMTEEARRFLAQANVFIERQDYSQGASAYLQVIEQSPWVVDAYYNLAQIYAAAEDYPNAIRTMQHFLILPPDGLRSREARDSIYTWEVSL